MAKQNESGASLRPTEMAAGGALIDDADVTIVNPQFVLYDFNGKSDTKVCLSLVLKTDDGEEHTEYLSTADPKHFQPSSDGKRCVAVADKANLNNSSKFALFITSLVNAGFPESEIGDSVDFLEGLRVHIMRKAAPKSWSTIKRAEGQREATILEVTAILDEKKPAAGAKGGAAKGAAGKPAGGAKTKGASAADAIDAELEPLVQQALSEAGAGLDKKALVPAIFRLASGDNKKAMVKRVFEDEFLMAGMGKGLWSFDGETVEAA